MLMFALWMIVVLNVLATLLLGIKYVRLINAFSSFVTTIAEERAKAQVVLDAALTN
tara:strand:+ start:604 stop:771 length:168 start_codon:yes stop_codon:yes gene_type:complete